MKFSQLVTLTLTLVAAFVRADSDEHVDTDAEATVQAPPAVFKPTTISGVFVEQFVTPKSKGSVWIPSEAKKVVDGIEDDELLKFRGAWSIEEASVLPSIKSDLGLVVKTPAAHHAISAAFPSPFDTKDSTFVAQYVALFLCYFSMLNKKHNRYEVKLQNGLECGGAYMKLLTYDTSFTPAAFSDKSPYTIMFGPDRCGSTNKVHFIFRHKNPKTGVIEEKHLNSPGTAKIDKLTNVYTLVVRPDNSFDVLINDESVKSGNLLEDFTPAVNPPKLIDDPEDSKPEDWVDVARISDPDARKPDDWDETAPREIIDEDATIPDDWLANEPKSISDPDSTKPEDWDDEEDGEWTAPTVENPKCADVSGCGPWSKPLKPNPAYKGKWKAPLIDNPAYKGAWAPRKIENPDWFEDKQPSNFGKIGAIGFELWTMQNGILFDNIYIGDSEEDAKTLRKETWAVKHKIESEQEAKNKPAQDSSPEDDSNKSTIQKLISRANAFRTRIYKLAFRLYSVGDYTDAITEHPAEFATIVFCVVYLLYTLSTLVQTILGLFKSTPVVAAEESKAKTE
ncbi:hypothetical protein HK100_000765 [Physocladia obscura]|uniref:Calnexin n=1 Tax=Physocladia obscura TaxID=109957 RepID=A0AAD5SY62_9FUNG|nr:hypothetical protein HK100_000765 [Physocladia obscura]